MKQLLPLFKLRGALIKRNLMRRARNARVYLDWQAVIIYIYAGAFLLSGPAYYLIFPQQIPEPIRQAGALLLTISFLLFPLWSLYRALFRAVDSFPSTIPVGDVQFVLSAPIEPAAFLADRVLWSVISNAILGLLLVGVSWMLGHGFVPFWRWSTSLALGGVFLSLSVAAEATAMLIYCFPVVRRVLTFVRTGLLGFAAIVGLRTIFGFASLATQPPAFSPTQLSALLPVDLMPRTSLVLLAGAGLWAVVAIGLLLVVGKPNAQELADDAFGAVRRRVASHTGRRSDYQSSPGAARRSFQGWWSQGRLAIVWRQVASYRHLAWRAWPARAFGLLAVVAIPAFMQWRGPGEGVNLLVLLPIMGAVSTASGFARGWRDEIHSGLTRRLLPVTSQVVVDGWAIGSAIIVSLFASVGVLMFAVRDGWAIPQSLSAIFLAITGGMLVAALALHEEWAIEVSATGLAEGVRAGKTTSLVISGATVIVARALADSLSLTLAMCLTGMLATVGALLLLRYLAFNLNGWAK